VSPSPVPEKVGRYEIRTELGRGAMGAVFRGFDPQLGRDVAIKMISAAMAGGREERDEIAERFQREARVAARLHHPNVVGVYDAGREGDSLYLVMELIDGETLGQKLARGDFPSPQQALLIAAQAADALASAHEAGVVHRDIKPGNLLLTGTGKVKVSDFGVAKAIGETTELTRTGMMVGSPAYMAPEQVKGIPLDGRSDLFSLGVVLYEMLLRRKPFPADTVTSLVYQILHEDPLADLSITSSLSADLADFLRWALAKDREERIPDAGSFAEKCRALAAQGSTGETAPTAIVARSAMSKTAPALAPAAARGAKAPPAPPAAPAATPARSKSMVWLALAAAGALALAAVAWLLRPPPAPQVGAEEPVATLAGEPLPQPEAPGDAVPTPEATVVPTPTATRAPVRVATLVPAPTALPTLEATPEPIATPEIRLSGTFEARSTAEFHVSPEETVVTIDGRRIGIADDWDGRGGGKKYVFPGPGSYLVELSLEGYRTTWVRVVISPDARRKNADVDTELEEIEED
jgi:serine/threonine-protein kinase